MRPTDDAQRAAKGGTQAIDVRLEEEIETVPASQPFSGDLMKELGLRGLNCGSGIAFIEGWLNVDMLRLSNERGEKSVAESIVRIGGQHLYLEHNATEPFPIEDGAFDWIFSEHFIEHIPPLAARRWLAEMRRMLRPGGLLRITTPDLRLYVDAYQDPTSTFFREHRARLTGGDRVWPEAERRAWWFNQIFRFWWHEFIYDFDELRWLAEKVGYEPGSITQRRFGESSVPEVAQLDMEFRSDESLYVEIVRS